MVKSFECVYEFLQTFPCVCLMSTENAVILHKTSINNASNSIAQTINEEYPFRIVSWSLERSGGVHNV